MIFGTSPNPDDYPKNEIFNYPFIRNKKGYIWIGSKNDEEAYMRMKLIERGGGSYENLRDPLLEEAIASGEFTPSPMLQEMIDSGEFMPELKKQKHKKPSF